MGEDTLVQKISIDKKSIFRKFLHFEMFTLHENTYFCFNKYRVQKTEFKIFLVPSYPIQAGFFLFFTIYEKKIQHVKMQTRPTKNFNCSIVLFYLTKRKKK